MEDKKLKMECVVVLDDFLKNFQSASESFRSSNLCQQMPTAEKYQANSHKSPKQHSDRQDKQSDSSRFYLKRSPVKISSDNIKTSRKYVSLTSQDLAHPLCKHYSSLMSMIQKTPVGTPELLPQSSKSHNEPAKLVIQSKPAEEEIERNFEMNTCDKLVNCNVSNETSISSTDKLVLDPKNGKLYEPVQVQDNDSEDRNFLKSSNDDQLMLDIENGRPNRHTALADGLILDNGKLYTNPLCSMPMVGLTVNAGIGHPLPSLTAKCALTCLDECRTLMTSEFAEFCSAVVKSSPELKTERIVLPIKDDQILQLMQIKWNSKCNVSQFSLPSSLNGSVSSTQSDKSQEKTDCSKEIFEDNQKAACSFIKRKNVRKAKKRTFPNSRGERATLHKRAKMFLLDNSKRKTLSGIADEDISEMKTEYGDKNVRLLTKSITNSIDSDDDEMRTVTKKTAFEVPEALYDSDDARGVQKLEENAMKPKRGGRTVASHVMLELRRLNVAVFDMPTSLETVVCKSPDICRLGCVCSSLSSSVVRDNCGLEKCMFGCICLKRTPSSDRGNQSYAWVQKKAKQNLAKEERNFKQAVVRSGNDKLILVEGRRKREIKKPKKYSEDFLSTIDFRPSKTTKELSIDRIDSEFSSSSLLDSARTAFYDYKASKAVQSRQKQLIENDETSKKNYDDPQLFKIESTQSLDQNDWEYPEDSEETANSVATPSCSYLFDAEYIKNNASTVNILPWKALWGDISSKRAFVWYQPTLPKPKLYLTSDSTKPFSDCLDLHLVDITSKLFLSLPEYLKALKTGSLPSSSREVGWVMKYIRAHWMLMGLIQKNQPRILSEQTFNGGEVDILPSINEDYPSRWWVMDLSQSFDLLYFMDFKKALTKRQMNTLLKLSNGYSKNENKVHRILLNRHRPTLNHSLVANADFGAYSVSKHPNKVFIGPYHTFNEPKFQVFSQKAAPNGKTQYIGVPLFYCGSRECVRVTSQGVLSLHSESLPDVYVQGCWYQSFGNSLRESCEKPLLANKHSSKPETLDLTNTDDEISPEIIHINEDDGNSEIETVTLPEDKSFSTLVEQVDDDENKSIASSMENESRENDVENIASAGSSSKSVASSPPKSDDSESDNESSAGEDQLKQVYMIPSDPKIGYVSLTFLPGGSISVPHFTETASVKFYRARSDIVADINRLIHKKLSCLSRKCSVLLQNNDVCKCVQWRFSNFKSECQNLPRFTPAIFNGFFMLTKYGLIDLRSAEENVIQKLGKDWVDWMKNDQIRLKLQHWKNKEEQEVLEEKLKTILSLNKDLPLPEVLSIATSEIAKLKAVDQLLDYESQSQKLLRESLINSLCRKLDGIPADVVPKFLEHLEFSLLWEVLECMNTRKTIIVSVDKMKKPKKRSIDLGEANSKPKEANFDQSSHIQALRYMERLQEEIRQEEEKKEKSQKDQPKRVPSRGSTSTPSSSSANGGVQLKDGVACRMSPFSGINICVEENGIKYASTSSPPSLPCKLKASPEKPSILRKSTGPVGVGGSSPQSNVAQKQARKQIFPAEEGEEPLLLEDPNVCKRDLDFDPISSLRITSVVSGAKSATAPLQAGSSPAELIPERCSTFGQRSVTNCATDASPVPSLANVFSTRDTSTDFSLVPASRKSHDVPFAIQPSTVFIPPSAMQASKSSVGRTPGFLKLKGTGTFGPLPAHPSLVTYRPVVRPGEKNGRIAVPAPSLQSHLVHSDKQGVSYVRNVFNECSGGAVSLTPVPKTVDTTVKTVHILKGSGLFKVHSSGSTQTKSVLKRKTT